MSRFLSFAICGALFYGTASGARVALVVPDENLESALTAGLSKRPGIEIVERTALSAIAREAALTGDFKSLAGADLVAIGEKASKDSFSIRVVDPVSGAVLQTFETPPGLDMQRTAEWLALRLSPWLNKTPAKVSQRFSLIGLRFDVDSAANRQTERSLNLAFAAALQAAPDAVVLERWRLNDLLFEKGLTDHGDTPFWSAARVIDGSISQQTGHLRVQMRIRAGGKESQFEALGETRDLNALANKLATLALQSPPSPGSLPKQESYAYLEEAQWLSKQGLKKESAQAVETAIALGYSGQHVDLQRICAYAEAAYPNSFYRKPSHNGTINETGLPAESLPASVALATTMCRLAVDYMETYSSMERPAKPDLPYPPNLGVQALSFPLSVLQTAYKQGYWKQNPAALAELRSATRQLIDTIWKSPLADEDDWHDLRGAFYRQLIPRAAYWNSSPEETLKFYDWVLSPEFEKECPDGKYHARWNLFFVERRYTPPVAVRSGPSTPDRNMTVSSHRLIDWNDPANPKVDTLWENYIAAKIASPAPLEQADGMAFLFTSTPTYAGRAVPHALQAEFFFRHSDELFGPNGDVIWDLIGGGVAASRSSTQPYEDQQKLIELTIKLLSSGKRLPSSFVGSLGCCVQESARQRVPETEGRRLLEAFNKYKESLAQFPLESDKNDFKKALTLLKKVFPNLIKTESLHSLPVHRAWIASEHVPEEMRRSARFDPDSGVWHDGRLWYLDAEDRKIWKIDPATFATETLTIPNRPTAAHDEQPPSHGAYVGIRISRPFFVGDKLYLPEQGSVWVADLAKNQWSALPLPDAHYSLSLSGTTLYATFGDSPRDDKVRRGEGFGLYEIDSARDTARLIFSSRRRPVSHPLDEVEGERPFCILPAAGGDSVVGMLLAKKVFHRLSDGREEPLVHSRMIADLVSRQGDNLFFATEYRNPHILHGVQRVSPAGVLETLLWNPESEITQPATPVWKFPDAIAEIRATANQVAYIPAMHGEDLLLLVYQYGDTPWGARQADLFRFRRGEPAPTRTPLSFRLTPEDKQIVTRYISNSNGFSFPLIDPYGVTPTDHGLALTGRAMPGFWFIPWSDIEKRERASQ